MAVNPALVSGLVGNITYRPELLVGWLQAEVRRAGGKPVDAHAAMNRLQIALLFDEKRDAERYDPQGHGFAEEVDSE